MSIRRETLDSPVAQSLTAARAAALPERYPEPGAGHFSLAQAEVADGCGCEMLKYPEAFARTLGARRPPPSFCMGETL